MTDARTYFLFHGDRRVATGEADDIARRFQALEAAGAGPPVIIDQTTGRTVDLPPPGLPRRGRPKLGVTAREVTLLPRHWDWLARQPGGASVVLRRLVEAASKAAGQHRAEARDAAYHAMATLAGNRPGFEEATRALYAGDPEAFSARVAAWPADIGATVQEMAGPWFGP